VRDEFLDPEPTSDREEAEDVSLRPRRLDEFIGQRELKEHLAVVLEAARRRGQAVDHLLFAGPPGVGKTSLSGIVAVEMGVRLHVTSGPALERAGDLAAILTKLEDGDVREALVGLGYGADEIRAAVIDLGDGPVEDLLRSALRQLAVSR